VVQCATMAGQESSRDDRIASINVRRERVVIEVERLPEAEGLPLPAYQTAGSSGMDLHAAITEDEVIGPGRSALIPAGIKVAVPPGYEAQVRPRSGLALRHGVMVPNTPGTIDSDYRGPVMVILFNAGREPFTVRRGDRIAQMVIAPVCRAELREVPALDDTERSAGGFGHTGQ
jgi:dUTP pyrophosphatase